MHGQAAIDALPMTGTPSVRALQPAQLVRQATGRDLEAFEELIGRLQAERGCLRASSGRWCRLSSVWPAGCCC
jgi:hypothetical protein